MSSKVLGIGLSKTGTHSLTRALEMLGYRAIHYPSPALMLEGRYDEAIGPYDAATDISVSAFYRELDRAYPGSRFILTIREPTGWLDSVEDHRRRRAHEDTTACPKAGVREIVYGTRGFDREMFARAAQRHTSEVMEYFADRPDDLLVLDVCGEPGDRVWKALCRFLDRPIPDCAFPYKNARAKMVAD
jgi:hypothetical protein